MEKQVLIRFIFEETTIDDGNANDDLVTVARLGDRTHNARDLLNGVLVNDRGILEFETQTRSAVG